MVLRSQVNREKIDLFTYIFYSKYMFYESKPGVETLSPQQLLLKVDQHFQDYLSSTKCTEKYTPTDLQPFWDDVNSGLGIANKLRAAIEWNWDSQEPIVADEFIHRGLSYEILVAPDPLDEESNHDYSQLHDTTPAIIGLRRWLGVSDRDERIGMTQSSIWGGFVDYLEAYYFQRHELTKQEQLISDVKSLLCHEFYYSATLPVELEEVAAKVQALSSQFQLADTLSEVQLDALKSDLQSFYTTTEEEGLERRCPIFTEVEHADMVLQVLQYYFPDVDVSNELKRATRLATVYYEDEIVAQAYTSSENFFFNPPESVFADDHFPGYGAQKMLPGRINQCEIVSEYPDTSTFDANGKKVFFGDQTHDDIKNYKGTYYVLMKRDVGELEKFLRTKRPDRLPERKLSSSAIRSGDGFNPAEEILLSANYVRLKATGAIVNGVYIENPIGSGI